MINVRHASCLHEGCVKLPYFSYEGEKRGQYCLGHKLDGMVDVLN
ncbi:unnamed protein product, partial [Heterosigma akashiwo]